MALTPSRSSTLTESSAELLHEVLGGKIDLHSEAIHVKIKETIESKPVQDQTFTAIKELNKTVRDIGQAFQKIRHEVKRFDDEGLCDKDLTSEWDELHEHFNEILDTSRDNATEAAAFMQQFTDTMLEDVEEPDYPTLKEELNNFRIMLAEREEKALKAKKDFGGLAEDVRLFGTTIDLVVGHVDTDLTEQIHATQDRIANLHAHLQHISDETAKMTAACLASFATAALGVSLAIVTLSPDAFVLAITSAVALGHSSSRLLTLRRERKDVKKELDKCSEEVVQLMDRQDTLKASLESAKSDIKQLSSKISTIANIWQSLKADLHSFEEQLNHAVNPKLNITKLFPKKIANTRGLYKTLIVLLDAYAKATVNGEDDETLCEYGDNDKAEW